MKNTSNLFRYYLRNVPGTGAVEFVSSTEKLPFNHRRPDNAAPITREGIPSIMRSLRDVHYPFGFRVIIGKGA